MTRLCQILLVLMMTIWLLEGSYFEAEEKPKKKCGLTRSRRMLAADCHRMDLTEIPADLDTAIQVMDISYNRLRQLPCDAFNRYSSITMLYVSDNLLTNLEDGVFMSLQSLEVLDLSLNGLQTIPIDVISLPKIRKLYLDRNHLGTKGFQAVQDSEIKSPLDYLSTAYCGLNAFPPLAAFPDLKVLNVSGNDIKTILPEQLAPACHLELLDLNYNEHLFDDNDCLCRIFEIYLIEKNIKLVQPFQLNCDAKIVVQPEDDCGNVSTEAEVIYSHCRDQKLSMIQQKEVIKGWVIGGAVLAVILLVLGVVAIVCWRRRVRRRAAKRAMKRGTPITPQNNNLNRPEERNPDGAEHDPNATLLPDRGFNITNIQNM